MSKRSIGDRVFVAVTAGIQTERYTSLLDVITRMGFLSPNTLDAWRKGRIPHLDDRIQAGPEKLQETIRHFLSFVKAEGLQPTEAPFLRATREGPKPLQMFSQPNPELEKLLRTTWVSPSLEPNKREMLRQKVEKPPEPVVFDNLRDSACSECGAGIPEGAFLFMEGGEPLCLPCSNLDDLEFLPSGDTALTRRASKYSSRRAVVVRFSRSRGRYERKGVLVEPAAIQRAEQE